MSNARSPREVCSTTIGTSGLIVLALVSLRRPDSSRRLATGRPQPAGRRGRVRLILGLLRCPQLFPRLGLRNWNRSGPGRYQLHGLTGGEILAHLLKAPAGSQVREQLLGLDALPLGGRRDDLEKLLLGRA